VLLSQPVGEEFLLTLNAIYGSICVVCISASEKNQFKILGELFEHFFHVRSKLKVRLHMYSGYLLKLRFNIGDSYAGIKQGLRIAEVNNAIILR
jgi:hypothetical protein